MNKFYYFLKNGAGSIEDVKPATKIAVIRCDIVSEACPGVGCFMAFNKRSMYFSDYNENSEMVAFFTCGGCSGRRVYRLLKSLKKRGVDVVHLSSCMQMENYPKCPHIDEIRNTVKNAGIELVEGTHH
ncbi:CGGC domain-containing protein [Methanolobus bombayensis]|uniref:CGGC domain-containing protein n=1 Tax=Methanolobus bombayensis TaxID=38023 RepID=UPI001FD83F60|nr:CGGC domain-containing protein [Methanolobus bombayensis]MBP1909386.1 putative metal-binding protein [Methanolobus bombayensis]